MKELNIGCPGKRREAYLSLVLILFFTAFSSYGQTPGFAPVNFSDSVYQVSGKKLIIPALLMGYGFAQFSIHPIVDLNLRLRSEITSRDFTKTHIDNYSQYAPGAAVYALNFVGIKGKHDFIDRSVILATSFATMAIMVNGIKQLTHIERPDGSTFEAFPSGHTATAFTCAEFLYQEYREKSVWIGVAGYTVAAGTGFLRMYNNRHWLTDVVAGAGFGILSTKFAYWVFPTIKKLLFKHIQVNFSFMPSFDFRNVPLR